MKDPLKTFLERASNGGFDSFVAFGYDIDIFVDPDREDKDGIALLAVMLPEAAEAVWGESTVHECGNLTCPFGHQGHPRLVWVVKQHRILDHIQNGDTPLEALSKEL